MKWMIVFVLCLLGVVIVLGVVLVYVVGIDDGEVYFEVVVMFVEVFGGVVVDFIYVVWFCFGMEFVVRDIVGLVVRFVGSCVINWICVFNGLLFGGSMLSFSMCIVSVIFGSFMIRFVVDVWGFGYV